MEQEITVKKLKALCDLQIKKGNGDKKILISNDDEGNGFHSLLFSFTETANDFKDVIYHIDEKDLKDYIILG